MQNKSVVAHVTTAHPCQDNRIFRKECVSLVAAGLEVHLVAVTGESTTTAGVRIDALPQRSGRFFRMLVGPVDAWKALLRVRPDMIHVHDPELIPMALLWRFLFRKPAVFDAHEDLAKQVMGKSYIPRLIRGPVARFARILEALADMFLSGVVAATPSIGRNFRRAPVTLVQNFPWLKDFPSPEVPPSDIGLTLSYVGGISLGRGLLEMVEAVQRSSRAPRLVLAGSASVDITRALSADTTGRIDFRGLLPMEDVPSIIANSHAGLVLFHPLPNNLESQPTKLFEYMASERPFIASSFPFWKELLGEFDCGFFIDPLDVSALIGIMDWLAQHPKEAEAMGARGRQALQANFTFENESKRLIEMTRNLLYDPNRLFPVTGADDECTPSGTT